VAYHLVLDALGISAVVCHLVLDALGISAVMCDVSLSICCIGK